MYTLPIESPMGVLYAYILEEGLAGLYFADRAALGNKKFYGATGEGVCGNAPPAGSAEAETAEAVRAWLSDYFSGGRPSPHVLKLAPSGSPFRLAVWRLLLDIPYGQTTSYGELAAKFGPRMSAQAVGGAVGANPIPIIVPCHRVIGKDGSLTGFAGGLDKKIFLLGVEGIAVSDGRIVR